MAPNNATFVFAIVSLALPLVAAPTILQAQHLQEPHRAKVVSGIVIDATTSLGIPNTYIYTSRSSAISDSDGNFSIVICYGDTLRFSHVSYMGYQTTFNKELDHAKFAIALNPKITFLKEVTVTGLPTETEFRSRVLETVPQLSAEEEIAQENIRILNHAMKFALPMKMDSYQSYRDYMKGPQGVVIFSSNGSKGLVRAIKNVIHSTPYKFPSTFRRANNSLINTGKAGTGAPIR